MLKFSFIHFLTPVLAAIAGLAIGADGLGTDTIAVLAFTREDGSLIAVFYCAYDSFADSFIDSNFSVAA